MNWSNLRRKYSVKRSPRRDNPGHFVLFETSQKLDSIKRVVIPSLSAIGQTGSRLQIACDRRKCGASGRPWPETEHRRSDPLVIHVSDPIPTLQGCDAFLMVSMGDGFGLALAEAMACGTAVVAARSGALSDIVEDGEERPTCAAPSRLGVSRCDREACQGLNTCSVKWHDAAWSARAATLLWMLRSRR